MLKAVAVACAVAAFAPVAYHRASFRQIAIELVARQAGISRSWLYARQADPRERLAVALGELRAPRRTGGFA
ncbi:hypothetical protein ACIBCT_06525 [Streptosporangium sp. NPDC050855]|uniref:hypothetical protein n=1 Tax=Streptosporangium sp. NPDC050855 TaxID=3366194 RepID=UPI0037B7A8F6